MLLQQLYMWAAAHLGLSWEWRESARRWECQCCCRHCSLDCRFPRCCHYREREEVLSILPYHTISEVYSMYTVCRLNQNREYCIPQLNLTSKVIAVLTVIFFSAHLMGLPEYTTLTHKIKMQNIQLRAGAVHAKQHSR